MVMDNGPVPEGVAAVALPAEVAAWSATWSRREGAQALFEVVGMGLCFSVGELPVNAWAPLIGFAALVAGTLYLGQRDGSSPYVRAAILSLLPAGWRQRLSRRVAVDPTADTDPKRVQHLTDLLERVAARMHVTAPRLRVVGSSAPVGAGAIGLTRRDISLVINEAYMDMLSDPQIEAILAHELQHVGHHDAVRAVAPATISLISILELGQLWHARGWDRSLGGALLFYACGVALYVAARWLVIGVLGRRFEIGADARAARVTSPDAMASALARMVESAYQKEMATQDHHAPAQGTRRLGWWERWGNGDLRADWLMRLWDPHPSTVERIRLIYAHAGAAEEQVRP